MLKLHLLLLFMLCFLKYTEAQSDLQNMHNKKITTKRSDHNHRSDDAKGLNNVNHLKTKHHTFFATYNPITLFFQGSMYFYQHAISRQFFSSCAYQRSCSNFSKEAISQFGLLKGLFLSADRISRCNMMVYQNAPINKLTKSGHIIDEPRLYKIYHVK